VVQYQSPDSDRAYAQARKSIAGKTCLWESYTVNRVDIEWDRGKRGAEKRASNGTVDATLTGVAPDDFRGRVGHGVDLGYGIDSV